MSSKKVKNVESGKVFNSIAEAGRFYNVFGSNINYVVGYHDRTVKGLHFVFVDPNDIAERSKKVAEYAKNKHEHCRPVICIETGITYPSVKKAAESNYCDDSTIHYALKDPINRTAIQYHWKYVDS